jgi:hypothetical protein
MLKENVQKELTRFGKYVVQQSRSNLSKKDKNVSSKLYNSIGYESKANPNSIEFSFSMLDYGNFQDKGVSGKEKRYDTPYAYTNKRPPSQPLAEWAKKRNIRLRDDKGRFSKGNYKTIGIILANSIYKKGIKPSLFFTRPFNLAFEKLPEELVEAYSLDLDNFLKFTLNDN